MDNDIAKSHNKQLKGQMQRIGSWYYNQNLLYLIFLQKNREILISKKKKRKLRVYDMMSDFISTRNPLQCRSHHQKLIQKFVQVKNIISYLKKYFSRDQYKNKLEELDARSAFNNQTQNKNVQVEEEDLNQRGEQLGTQIQKSPPVQVQNKMQQMQKLYNQYIVQMMSQINEYSRLNLYFCGLQILP